MNSHYRHKSNIVVEVVVVLIVERIMLNGNTKGHGGVMGQQSQIGEETSAHIPQHSS